ncbi:hypothetical protein LWC34_51185 [Kibdelosporangium philippinense]|uniref:SPW repeat-containing protein n=1 Tax=Kibdelosporangium philippinense TaxID=211113 RepID=A0ABS8ZTV2_9PSEU|nr:hypothetical protein [Kibdelosporangium philippinense]MCE7011117.1 hypothetical protein [Kibdelosporangium philippinense]
MKRLLSILIAALAAGIAGYIKSGDEPTATAVGLAFAIPIAILVIALPGFKTVVPAAVMVASLLLLGPTNRTQGSNILSDWALLWTVWTISAVVVTGWLVLSRRRKAPRPK